MNTKKWFLSRTIWLAVVQGLLGVVVAVAASDPTMKLGGTIVVLKTILDVLLRLDTTTTLTT